MGVVKNKKHLGDGSQQTLFDSYVILKISPVTIMPYKTATLLKTALGIQ